MKVNIQDFISFQAYMLRKQAARGAEHLPAIKCRHELEAGTKCQAVYEHDTCRDCAGEWMENGEKGVSRER